MASSEFQFNVDLNEANDEDDDLKELNYSTRHSTFSLLNFQPNNYQDDTQFNDYNYNKKRRSKSEEPILKKQNDDLSSLSNYYVKRTKNKFIERGVRIINSSLSGSNVASMTNKQINKEKEVLNELNTRLKYLLDKIKEKKNFNLRLENEIRALKESVLANYDESKPECKFRKQANSDCMRAKRELNKLSELSSLEKIKQKRFLYEINRFKDLIEIELKSQQQIRDKCLILEKLNCDNLCELKLLSERFNEKLAELNAHNNRNETLHEKLKCLHDQLEAEIQQRVDLESRIQTLIETKRFEQEINQLSKNDAARLCDLLTRLRADLNANMLEQELPGAVKKIREEFGLEQEFNIEQLRYEYELKYKQVEEEYDTRCREEALDELAQLDELKSEHERNANELNALNCEHVSLSRRYDELCARLRSLKSNINAQANSRTCEQVELCDEIRSLKQELAALLTSSKSLDGEVSLYACLLNKYKTNKANKCVKKCNNAIGICATSTTTTTKSTITTTNTQNNNEFMNKNRKKKKDNCKNSKKALVLMNLSTNTNNSNVTNQKSRLSRSQSPQLNFNNNNSKYAIKHKANRYVSGAIGILEVALNGDYILLENLSSNKQVNLKNWFIHRYIPDKCVNIIFKFSSDLVLIPCQKLKLHSKFSSTLASNTKSDFKLELSKYDDYENENTRVLIANNVHTWGSYSKFSVTKLINADGVDKAVLTTSLLRLSDSSSTSTNNLAFVHHDDPSSSFMPCNANHSSLLVMNNQNNRANRCSINRSKSNLQELFNASKSNSNCALKIEKEIRNVQTIRQQQF